MPRVSHSITIRGNLDETFVLTNEIPKWPEFFEEYTRVEILAEERYDRFAKVEFALTNQKGQIWRSWRILDYKDKICIAARVEPLFPFLYMHLTWTYTPVPEGVEMTWIQDFELDPNAPFSQEQAVMHISEHTEKNQLRFKERIELLGHALVLGGN